MEDRRNLYLYYKKDDRVSDTMDHLLQLAEKHGFSLVTDYKQANIIVSVGGDGTFLQAVRETGFRDDCLYAGISTRETLNMYCDFHINNTEKIIEAMSTELLEVRRYPTIEVTINDDNSFFCLNECTVRSSIIRTFVLDVLIDDLPFETFRGDGMIVATPTGSTAYNKSIKGAVVDPTLLCMQVSELASVNNNRYRTLDSSFILGPDRKLTMKLVQDGNDYPVLGMDNEALSINHVNTIDFKLSGKYIKTVKLKDNSFWEKVRRTFL